MSTDYDYAYGQKYAKPCPDCDSVDCVCGNDEKGVTSDNSIVLDDCPEHTWIIVDERLFCTTCKAWGVEWRQ